MKCEKCGKTMETGFLGSDSYLIFTKEKKKLIPTNYEFLKQAPISLLHVYLPTEVCFKCKIGKFKFD